jgi:hypothetical protein
MSLKTRLGRLELATGGKRERTPFVLLDMTKMSPIKALAHFDAFRDALKARQPIVCIDPTVRVA